MSDQADQVAREIANRAVGMIEKHEAVCAERQGHIISDLGELKRGVTGLYRRVWGAAIGIITTLLAACGTLFYFIITHGPG